jgi:hypothetical protein
MKNGRGINDVCLALDYIENNNHNEDTNSSIAHRLIYRRSG